MLELKKKQLCIIGTPFKCNSSVQVLYCHVSVKRVARLTLYKNTLGTSRSVSKTHFSVLNVLWRTERRNLTTLTIIVYLYAWMDILYYRVSTLFISKRFDFLLYKCMSFQNKILFRYFLKRMYIFHNFYRHYFLTDIILFFHIAKQTIILSILNNKHYISDKWFVSDKKGS